MTRNTASIAAALATVVVIFASVLRGDPGATTQPAPARQAAAAQPGASATAPSLPPQYAILMTRNPFAQGGRPKGPDTGGPEASFVLKGVVEAGARFTAFIEDKASGRVVQMGVG